MLHLSLEKKKEGLEDLLAELAEKIKDVRITNYSCFVFIESYEACGYLTTSIIDGTKVFRIKPSENEDFSIEFSINFIDAIYGM